MHTHPPKQQQQQCSGRVWLTHLCCSFAVPLYGSLQRLRHAFSTLVQDAQAALRICISLLRRLAEELEGALGILLHACAFAVEHSEPALCKDMTLSETANEESTA